MESHKLELMTEVTELRMRLQRSESERSEYRDRYEGLQVSVSKGAFSLHWASGPPQIGRSLCLTLRRTLDPRPLFTPNRFVGCAIPDYFGANQWCRTCVSVNSNHSLPTTSKESQHTVYSFHYLLPLFLVQLRAVSRVNIVAKSDKLPLPMILV